MSDKSHDPNQMTGAAMIVRALIDHGVKHLFGYPGGAVLPIYDEIFQQSEVEHILVRHEQGAGHAAEGYARSTGKPGVVLVTSGPGATNMVTPLTDALMDSIPLVCITGQVPTHLIGNDAFQECDTVGITRPCTKHNWLVRDVNDLAKVLHEAFYVATTGRPGPVLVDVPKDVQFAIGTYHPPRKSDVHVSYTPRVKGDAAQIRKAVALLASAKRPVIYSGGGVINSGREASKLLRELVEVTGFPITSTLMGLGAYPATRARTGSACSACTAPTKPTWRCMIATSCCASARASTTASPAASTRSRRARRRSTSTSIRPRSTRTSASTCRSSATPATCSATCCRCSRRRRRSPTSSRGGRRSRNGARAIRCPTGRTTISSCRNMRSRRLFEATRGRDTYITTEVGQHQMWAAQFFGFEEPHRWMTSGGLGTMGYGLPAALGVQVAHPDSLVIDIAGDASVQMTMQEMSTAVQYELPIKIFILNNQYMGMVRQWQQLLHGNRLSHSYSEALPDFVKLADAFGCVGLQAIKPGDLDGAIKEMINGQTPVMFDCRVAALENCFPMIPSGKAHNEMLLPEEATDEATAAAFAGGKALV